MLERELLTELNTGDKRAFTSLYFTYSAQIYSKILRLTKCEETSQEILQELFLKVWERRSQINPEKPFKAYLFTIAQNLIYDHFRKVARDKVLVDNLISSASMYYRSEDSEVFEVRLQYIHKAIEHLPPVRKHIFKLSKIEGKSYEEIASIMQISTSTISDHIVKANRAIKKYLQMHADVTVSLFICILMDL
ncbi:sigma-70 family RNA polymerase sigma factor [Dyadobacter sp. CY327]|uniref:RNA polymerase sigma factor n=1 Tax=Dyadobacter sp. CY327 TaxID=2907301 RepID=UPI001F368CF7|nr:sigma-70 family RNA polymerase sigma factor [Dyadobacter sp. CY327]MCE7070120.1 sigma-70 family RNA polymerase sigma factor [Dyadobacter sp. CY327]